MTDLSNLSDDDLKLLHSMGAESASTDIAGPLSQMSDEELKAAYQQTPAEAPVTAGGLYNALDVGAARGIAGLAGLPRTISDLGASGIQAATNYVGGKLGLPPDTRDLSQPGMLGQLPTQQEALNAIQQNYYGGAQPYQPQNVYERSLETTGELLPNALFPGGGVSRAANVLVPAAAVSATREAGGGEVPQLAAGLLGGAAAGKLGNIAERVAATPLPTFQKMKDLADSQYGAIRNMLVAQPIPTTSISNVTDSIEQALHTQALRPGNAPETYKILSDLKTGTGRPADAADLLIARRNLGSIRGGEDGTAANAARTAIDAVMDMYVPGSGAALRTADQNYNAFKVAQDLNKTFQKAELQTAGTYSGLNLGNKLRQAATSLAVNPNRTRFMAPEDIARLQALGSGTTLQNAMRYGSGILGGGGGLGALAAGGVLGGEVFGGHEGGISGGIGGILAGLALRRGYNRSVSNAAQQLAQQALARSPQAIATGAQYIPPVGLLGAMRPGITAGGLLGLANQQPQLPQTPWPLQ